MNCWRRDLSGISDDSMLDPNYAPPEEEEEEQEEVEEGEGEEGEVGEVQEGEAPEGEAGYEVQNLDEQGGRLTHRLLLS